MKTGIKKEENLIRVLLIYRSESLRDKILTSFSSDDIVKIIDTASDLFKATQIILKQNPDVIIFDIDEPRLFAIEFLRRLVVESPTPVIILTPMTQKCKHFTLQMIESGAIEIVSKPKTDISGEFDKMIYQLKAKIKIAAKAKIVSSAENKIIDKPTIPENIIAKFPPGEPSKSVIAIGAASGGVEAIKLLLNSLPEYMPGILIVQILPPGFTKLFADRLNEITDLTVKEAEPDEIITNGKALVAPGNYHLTVQHTGEHYTADCQQSEMLHGNRPSIDVLMFSLSELFGNNAIGALLTGYGSDGTNGLLTMKHAGAKSIVQDENSSTVFEMQKSAIDIEAVDHILPLNQIPHKMIEILSDH